MVSSQCGEQWQIHRELLLSSPNGLLKIQERKPQPTTKDSEFKAFIMNKTAEKRIGAMVSCWQLKVMLNKVWIVDMGTNNNDDIVSSELSAIIFTISRNNKHRSPIVLIYGTDYSKLQSPHFSCCLQDKFLAEEHWHCSILSEARRFWK